MPLNEYSYINRPEEEPVQVPERTSLADIPRNRSLLELATGIETAEDIGPISENWLVRDWILPGLTGASAKTEAYQPGLLDMALAVPAFGVVGKAGRAAYASVKNLLRNRNVLLKAADAVSSSSRPIKERIVSDAVDLYVDGPSFGSLSRPFKQSAEEIDDLPADGIDWDALRSWDELTPSGQTAETISEVAAVPVRSADEVATDIVREYRFSNNVSWNDAQAVVSDIGEEGWLRFQDEINSLPLDQREQYFQNFIAKYKVTGQITGGDAAAAYKASRFTSQMPDQVMVIDKGRHGTLTYKSTASNKGMSEISLEWQSATSEWRRSNMTFRIQSKIDEAGNAFDQISDIAFHGHPFYSGHLLVDVLKKIPDNAVIIENSLTYDSLYLLIKKAIQNKAKIVFHKSNPKSLAHKFEHIKPTRRKQASSVSRESKWSHRFLEAKKLYKDTGNSKYIDEAVDSIMDEFRTMISEYAAKHPKKVVGRPKLKAIKDPGKKYLSYEPKPSEFYDRGRFEYNYISIHKMTAALAAAFGYKNKEEFMKFLSYDPESTEAQIFDNDFSL